MTKKEKGILEKILEVLNKNATDIDEIKGNLVVLQGGNAQLKSDMQFIKREVTDHTDMLKELIQNVVSQEEHEELKQRVRKLEIL